MSLADSTANQKAGDRVQTARGSIYAAFDSLDCGITHDEAIEYLHGSPHFAALGDRQGVALGMILGFAMVAVEADREPPKACPTCVVCGGSGEWLPNAIPGLVCPTCGGSGIDGGTPT